MKYQEKFDDEKSIRLKKQRPSLSWRITKITKNQLE